MGSPRVWRWKNRLNLLFMVSLVYALLLSLLAPTSMPLINNLFRHSAIEQENGTARLRYRFQDFVLR